MNQRQRDPESLGPFESVIFDCDSTLTTVEGIDLLAGTKKKEIAELTNAAMSGKTSFAEIYRRRLDLIRPDFGSVVGIGEEYIRNVTPQARDTVQALRYLKKRVILISGGFRTALAILARHLGINGERVFGVDLFFDEKGKYAGYDEQNRLTSNRGKIEVVRDLAGQGRRAVFIGDGMTDVEAGEAVDLFVGYGGVARRPEVEKASPYYITAPTLAALLPVVLTNFEQQKLLSQEEYSQAMRDGRAAVDAGGLITHV